MPSLQTIARLKSNWYALCHQRGTPIPQSSGLSALLQALPEHELHDLALIIELCVSAREKGGELDLLAWAAACTRSSLLAELQAQGIECTPGALFLAGKALMGSGWSMAGRIAHLAQNPGDKEQLRSALARQHIADEPMAAAPPPVFTAPAAPAESAEAPGRAHLKLYGRDCAHTLEIGPHRRGTAFLGVHVVTIESARALDTGGYDWARKLTVQLTPEEMPAAVAVLMNIRPSARFERHGPERDKFLELRWQADGIAVVTGQRSCFYAVPVKSSAVYYLRSLFCRALAQGQERGSVADVLALVGSMKTIEASSGRSRCASSELFRRQLRAAGAGQLCALVSQILGVGADAGIS